MRDRRGRKTQMLGVKKVRVHTLPPCGKCGGMLVHAMIVVDGKRNRMGTLCGKCGE